MRTEVVQRVFYERSNIRRIWISRILSLFITHARTAGVGNSSLPGQSHVVEPYPQGLLVDIITVRMIFHVRGTTPYTIGK